MDPSEACHAITQAPTVGASRSREETGAPAVGASRSSEVPGTQTPVSVEARPRTTIVLVGDSVMRHLLNGLQLLLSGNLLLGAMREGAPPDVAKNCTCERDEG